MATRSAAIETAVSGLGYELVEVERGPAGLLRITIDHSPSASAAVPRSITVDDCERVTRQLQHVLTVEGLAYERLEVSSPGLDRPLRNAADFARFTGEEVELTLKAPWQGRKRYRGELQRNGEAWRVVLASGKAPSPRRARKPAADTEASAQQALDFSLDEVREARLVPHLDFKGRSTAPSGPARAAPRREDKSAGGQRR